MNAETVIYAVIDTNVIVSALFSKSGLSNPARIMEAVINGTIIHLITGNTKHFPVKPFIVTPTQMIEILAEIGLI